MIFGCTSIIIYLGEMGYELVILEQDKLHADPPPVPSPSAQGLELMAIEVLPMVTYHPPPHWLGEVSGVDMFDMSKWLLYRSRDQSASISSALLKNTSYF